MSKTELRRALADLDRDQLQQLILDMYTARKDSRPYFDFFVNPDVNKLYDDCCVLVEKECRRVRRGGRTKTRISYLRNIIRDFESFGPGADNVLRLMHHVMLMGCLVQKFYYDTATLEKGLLKLFADMLTYGDKHLLFDDALHRANEIINNEATTQIFARELKRVLAEHQPNNPLAKN